MAVSHCSMPSVSALRAASKLGEGVFQFPFGALEKPGHARRERVDRAQGNRHVVVGDQLERFRQRQIAVGAAE